MIKRLTSVGTILMMLVGGTACGQSPAVAASTATSPVMAQPDLKIEQFLFPPSNDKALRVHVANTGGGNAGACVLRLTVRKINGVAVGRVTTIHIPMMAAGKDSWFVVHANTILPNNVALKDTTFKLNIDATSLVNESNETNNEVWHNL